MNAKQNLAFHQFVDVVAAPIARCPDYKTNRYVQRSVRSGLQGMVRTSMLTAGMLGLMLAGTQQAVADINLRDISRAMNSKDPVSGYVRLGDKLIDEAQRAMKRAQLEKEREERKQQREAERELRQRLREAELQQRAALRMDPNAALRAEVKAQAERVKLLEQKRQIEERAAKLGIPVDVAPADDGTDLKKLRGMADRLEAEHGFSKQATNAAHILPGNILGLKSPDGHYVFAGQTPDGEMLIERAEVDNPNNPLMTQVAKFRNQIETKDMGPDLR